TRPGKVSRIVEKLEFAVVADVHAARPRGFEFIARHGEMIIRQRVLAAAKALFFPKRNNGVLCENGLALVKACRRLPRTSLVHSRYVAQNQLVIAILVLEEIENALFFHQAGHEIKIRLVVLHAVIARLVGSLQAEIGLTLKAQVLKDLLDDVRGTFFLEDSAIRSSGQEP